MRNESARRQRAWRALLALGVCALALQGCGGGGGNDSGTVTTPTPTTPTPTTPTTPPTTTPPADPPFPSPAADAPTLLTLTSDVGDSVGDGKSYRYGRVNAVLSLSAKGNQLNVEVEGEERWSGVFVLPDKLAVLQPGRYDSKGGWPLHDRAQGGLQWYGDGRGCTAASGTIDINKVTYANGELRALDMNFIQYCSDQSSAALRGSLRWSADDATPYTRPLPVPDTLWRAPSGSVPASGNYVFVTSDPQHFIGEGDTFLYRSDAAELRASSGDRWVEMAVTASQRWDLRFEPMAPQVKLQPGYYAYISGRRNPALGSMNISGGRRSHGCERSKGWFVVEKADYAGSQLTALDLRFEMSCGALPGLLRGQVHWRGADPSQPGGPVNPAPASLWSAPANALPPNGNALYVESHAGDPVGRGQTSLYTNADALFTPSKNGSGLHFAINGDRWWEATFLPMSGLDRLQVGYYGNLGGNTALGYLLFADVRYNCPSGATGWFAVDSVSYTSGGELSALDLRFEQLCRGSTVPLRGRLRWLASDPSRPTGPVSPIPATLWAPAAGTVPATGNYVYLDSGPQDYIGAGRKWLYTPDNAVFNVERDFLLNVRGDEFWTGDFRPIYSHNAWRPGYYAQTRGSPSFSPARGGLSWRGFGRSCDSSTGWIAVDSVHYDTQGLHDIELRFEQFCDGSSSPLRGSVRWNRDDLSQPPGPVSPVPSALWSAPAAKLPSSGAYAYMESDATDYVGSGWSNEAHVYVGPLQASKILNYVSPEAIDFRFELAGAFWQVNAKPMVSLAQLKPGYYPQATRLDAGNPARGGLQVVGFSRGCNELHGWFAIDALRFEGGRLVQLDMRFEQRCDEGAGGALRGQIHWVP